MNCQFYFLSIIIFSFLNLIKSSCDSDDIQKITQCYHQHIFQTLQITAYNFATEKYANLAFSSQENLRRACSAKDRLDQCLDASTIQRCFNTPNFMKVPFANTEDSARKFIANYLQFDYACGDGNRIAKKACPYSTSLCPSYDPFSCTSFQAHAKCLGKAATNSCGRT
uniref:Uncharacterized protein n=1 Tax=Panagrolaimus sp. PS1159 TaxID=55785 RepID=A0AC35G6Z9_9BILA